MKLFLTFLLTCILAISCNPKPVSESNGRGSNPSAEIKDSSTRDTTSQSTQSVSLSRGNDNTLGQQRKDRGSKVKKEKLQKYSSDSISLCALFLSVLALVLSINKSKRSSFADNPEFQKEVTYLVINEDKIKKRIEDIVTSNTKEIERPLKEIINSISSINSSNEQRNKDIEKLFKEIELIKNARIPSAIPKTMGNVQEIILFARDSQSTELTTTPEYQQGKSIYKLKLHGENNSIATVSLCTEQEGAKNRILNYADDILKPVCDLIKNTQRPQSIVIEKEGKAEKKEADTWVVIEPVRVKLT